MLAGPEIFPRFKADLDFQKLRCRLKGWLLLHKYLLVSKRTTYWLLWLKIWKGWWCMTSKSLHRSCAWRHFYWTKNEIWAGFGSVGNTEKTIGGQLIFMSKFWGVFQDQKKIFKNCILVSKLKSCIKWRRENQKNISKKCYRSDFLQNPYFSYKFQIGLNFHNQWYLPARLLYT